jgi:hypothetical protein
MTKDIRSYIFLTAFVRTYILLQVFPAINKTCGVQINIALKTWVRTEVIFSLFYLRWHAMKRGSILCFVVVVGVIRQNTAGFANFDQFHYASPAYCKFYNRP